MPGSTRPAWNDTAWIALALLTFACSQARETSHAPRPTIAPCVVAGDEGRCGSLTVPENRTTRRGRTIDLKIVVLPARSRTPAPDPIFFLAGGPGQAATALSRGAFDPALQQDRDLVFVDQRGTGGSNPLECELPGSLSDPQSYLGDVFQVSVFEKCRDELASKADVTQYTTAAAADDLDDVRAALGYSRINLIGGSYGTRAALIYMRRHPASVRTAVLNGVAPASLKNPLYHARAAQEALDAVLAECAADLACHTAFPHVRDEFHSVIERLEKDPARVSTTMAETGTSAVVTLSRYAFAETIRMMLYRVDGSRQVPLVVHQAFRGDFSAVVQRAMQQRTSNAGLQHGMLLATTCAEDVARIREDEIAAATTGTYLGADRVTHQRQVCEIWPRGRVDDEDVAPVRSDAPVLLLSGTEDPVTRPAWADDARRSLPNGRHIIVPGAHGVGGMCIARIIRDFLNAGSAKDLDTTCTQSIRLPPFVIR